MHPLLIQQLAKLHMEELQREATTTRFANSAGVSSGNTTVTVTNLKQMRQGEPLAPARPAGYDPIVPLCANDKNARRRLTRGRSVLAPRATLSLSA